MGKIPFFKSSSHTSSIFLKDSFLESERSKNPKSHILGGVSKCNE